jgi:hypothetical protein
MNFKAIGILTHSPIILYWQSEIPFGTDIGLVDWRQVSESLDRSAIVLDSSGVDRFGRQAGKFDKPVSEPEVARPS